MLPSCSCLLSLCQTREARVAGVPGATSLLSLYQAAPALKALYRTSNSVPFVPSSFLFTTGAQPLPSSSSTPCPTQVLSCNTLQRFPIGSSCSPSFSCLHSACLFMCSSPLALCSGHSGSLNYIASQCPLPHLLCIPQKLCLSSGFHISPGELLFLF